MGDRELRRVRVENPMPGESGFTSRANAERYVSLGQAAWRDLGLTCIRFVRRNRAEPAVTKAPAPAKQDHARGLAFPLARRGPTIRPPQV